MVSLPSKGWCLSQLCLQHRAQIHPQVGTWKTPVEWSIHMKLWKLHSLLPSPGSPSYITALWGLKGKVFSELLALCVHTSRNTTV